MKEDTQRKWVLIWRWAVLLILIRLLAIAVDASAESAIVSFDDAEQINYGRVTQ